MLELERSKTSNERQLQLLQEKVKEGDQEVEHMRLRCEKVESQIQEQVFNHKREYEAGQERYQDMVNNYDKQIRELRAQANLKAKDL